MGRGRGLLLPCDLRPGASLSPPQAPSPIVKGWEGCGRPPLSPCQPSPSKINLQDCHLGLSGDLCPNQCPQPLAAPQSQVARRCLN